VASSFTLPPLRAATAAMAPMIGQDSEGLKPMSDETRDQDQDPFGIDEALGEASPRMKRQKPAPVGTPPPMPPPPVFVRKRNWARRLAGAGYVEVAKLLGEDVSANGPTLDVMLAAMRRHYAAAMAEEAKGDAMDAKRRDMALAAAARQARLAAPYLHSRVAPTKDEGDERICHEDWVKYWACWDAYEAMVRAQAKIAAAIKAGKAER
jgi:hypothetical protein